MMMNAIKPAEQLKIEKSQKYNPAVSIILPFEPKMCLKTELLYSLKTASGQVERELKEKFPADTIMQIMQKIGSVIRDLNFSTHKKSLVIYVTPEFQKVLYLDMPVERKIIIGNSFEIRDLLDCKKKVQQYLVLVISSKGSKLYLGNAGKLVQLLAAGPGSLQDTPSAQSQGGAGFTNAPGQKEKKLDKFLQHVDDSLHIVLNAYHFPLFVLGPVKVTGHFKSLSKHAHSVLEYIPGNYDDASSLELATLLEPYLNEWAIFREKSFLSLLEKAAGSKKLATGMRDVWRKAMNSKGKLLLVAKDYMYAVQQGNNRALINLPVIPGSKLSLSKGAVDEVIERVLESGGDVEFVDRDLLKDYHHIALVQYY